MEWNRLIEVLELELGIGPQARGELARRIEVRPGIVSDIKAGKSKNPSADFALRLINRLGVNPRWLADQELPILLGNGIFIPEKDHRSNLSGINIPEVGAPLAKSFDAFEGRSRSAQESAEKKYQQEPAGQIPLREPYPEYGTNRSEGTLPQSLRIEPGAVYLNANGREIISDEFVAISLLAQKVSAGPGQELLNYEAPSTVIPVYRRMLMGRDPRGAFGAMVEGDSMTGERIFEGDIVIFYRGLITENGLYVLFRDGRLFVKRLAFSFTTSRVEISSANDRYPKVEEVEDSQALTIAGKVLGWIHVHPY